MRFTGHGKVGEVGTFRGSGAHSNWFNIEGAYALPPRVPFILCLVVEVVANTNVELLVNNGRYQRLELLAVDGRQFLAPEKPGEMLVSLVEGEHLAGLASAAELRGTGEPGASNAGTALKPAPGGADARGR